MSKAILVTGATGNLGREVCKQLKSANYMVYGTILPGSKDTSDHATLLEADLTKYEDATHVIQEIKKEVPYLNGLVCLAGGFGMNAIDTTTDEEIAAFHQLNFATAFNITKAAWEWMKSEKNGRLIYIGAKPALEGGGFEVLPYALSKGSVIQMAHILNEQTNATGISAAVVVPSIIDTPPNRESMPDADYSKWVTTTEIAQQITHLLSENSKALRNPVLRIYGQS